MPNRLKCLAVVLIWAAVSAANVQAAQIEQLDIGRSGDDFTVYLEAVLDAPMEEVWRVLTDYARFHKVSPAIKDSEILEARDARTHRVRTRASACVLIFCKQTEQVQTMRQRALGDLAVDVEPALSDFEFGQAKWRLEGESQATRLRFEARIRPAFWVPPIIGPWAVRHVLREEAHATCEGLERLARTQLP